jgi:hypothetical protein
MRGLTPPASESARTAWPLPREEISPDRRPMLTLLTVRLWSITPPPPTIRIKVLKATAGTAAQGLISDGTHTPCRHVYQAAVSGL